MRTFLSVLFTMGLMTGFLWAVAGMLSKLAGLVEKGRRKPCK